MRNAYHILIVDLKSLEHIVFVVSNKELRTTRSKTVVTVKIKLSVERGKSFIFRTQNSDLPLNSEVHRIR